jgi:putative endopeptidase
MPKKHTRKQRLQPCADFYKRVNARWTRRTTLPPTETRITQAYFVRKAVDRELAAVIHAEEHEGGPVADLLSSWDIAAAEPVAPQGLTPLLQLMLAIRTPSDIAERIGWLCRHGISGPLSIYIQGDPRDHSRCRVFIEEGSPRIGIPEYWYGDRFASHRRAYKEYVGRLADILGLPALTQGLRAEHEFTNILTPAIPESKEPRINVRTWSELQREFPRIDWAIMLRTYGFTEEQMREHTYYVPYSAFMHHLQRRIHSWSPELWGNWFALLVAQYIAGTVPHSSLRSAWYGYARRYLQGMESDVTPAYLRNAIALNLMPNRIGKRWVREHCDPATKRAVTAMCERIREAAIAIIKESWMSPSTRTAAVRKLRKLDIQVCWPPLEKWKGLEPSLSPSDFVGNLLEISAVGTDFSIKKRRTCRDTYAQSWSSPVFEVNAFYFPADNKFLLPAAILRPPYYDPSKSLVSNYATIGATIGHELCHAFDADGRRYDENGDKRNWWTPHDEAEYKKRAAAVVNLYESAPYRGMGVNGRLTLVENIADIGGLEFALAGLRATLGRELTKAEKREFFTAFAIGWRSKDRLKRAAELLAVDSHSPPPLRVSHAVRQFNEWYEAFDITENCAGYIPPAERIRFFA